MKKPRLCSVFRSGNLLRILSFIRIRTARQSTAEPGRSGPGESSLEWIVPITLRSERERKILPILKRAAFRCSWLSPQFHRNLAHEVLRFSAPSPARADYPKTGAKRRIRGVQKVAPASGLRSYDQSDALECGPSPRRSPLMDTKARKPNPPLESSIGLRGACPFFSMAPGNRNET